MISESMNLFSAGLIGSSDVSDSIGYTAVKVNEAPRFSPRGRESPESFQVYERSPSPRHLVARSGNASLSIDSVQSKCPSPPTDLPHNGDARLSPRGAPLDVRGDSPVGTNLSDLRTSSSEDMFHSIVRQGSDSSLSSDDVPLKQLAMKLPAKTPARSRRKSPARTSISVSNLQSRFGYVPRVFPSSTLVSSFITLQGLSPRTRLQFRLILLRSCAMCLASGKKCKRMEFRLHVEVANQFLC